MLSFAHHVIGAMNFKPIMKSAFVIDVMPSSVRLVTRWTSAKIVGKLSVLVVVPFVVANFVDVAFVKNVPPPVVGKIAFVLGILCSTPSIRCLTYVLFYY